MVVKSIPERTTNLERLMAELTQNVNRFSHEMLDFKDEMADFKEESRLARERSEREMTDFKEESRLARERSEREMADFKEESRLARERSEREMADFRQGMTEFKQGMTEFRKELAAISNKMGTLVEDMVAPSIPRILQAAVNCQEKPVMEGIRIRKRLPDGRSQEYDAIAICGDYLLINETKSRLQPKDIPNFIQKLQEAHEFLAEYGPKQIVGALASFYVDPSLVTYGERQGLVMLGVVDGLMTILNQDDFTPQSY